jgi:hypothetical protein
MTAGTGHSVDAPRIPRGRGRAPPDLVLQLPQAERADEVGAQLRRGEPGPAVLRLRLAFLLEAAADHELERLVLGHAVGVDPDVDDRVHDGPQVVLPMGQGEGRVVGPVAAVDHDLCHVDRPALGERAVAVDGPDD